MTTNLAYISRNSSYKKKQHLKMNASIIRKDCKYFNYKLSKKKTSSNTRQDRDCNNLLKSRENNYELYKVNVIANFKDENLDLKLFCLRKVFMIIKFNIILIIKFI